MKKYFFQIATGFLLSASLLFSACSNSAKSSDPHGEGAAYISAYVCPMHCEGSGSDEMGKCPVCEMDYVKQDEHVKDGHTH